MQIWNKSRVKGTVAQGFTYFRRGREGEWTDFMIRTFQLIQFASLLEGQSLVFPRFENFNVGHAAVDKAVSMNFFALALIYTV
jgi:hypothetical protein